MAETVQENPSERESLLALAEAAERVGGGRKKSERVSGKSEKDAAGYNVAQAAQRLFDPLAWKALCKSPFKLAKAMTGESCVDITEEEANALSTATATWAEYNLPVDPARVSLVLMASTWLAIVSEKAGAYYMVKQAEEEEKKKYGQGMKAV